jgi:hypothetical protein
MAKEAFCQQKIQDAYMAKDYVPGKLSLYRLFSDHFVELVSQKAVAWGISDTAKTRLTDGHSAWVTAQADNPDTRTLLAIKKARRLRKEDIANIRWMVNFYINPNSTGSITVEDRLDLGLHIKDSTLSHHPAPTSRPDRDVVSSGKYQHTVTALDSANQKKEKPADAYGVQYAWQVGEPTPAAQGTCPSQSSAGKYRKNLFGTPVTKVSQFITQQRMKIPKAT